MTFSRTGGSRTDLHAQITDTIIEAIEQGSGQWQLPWRQEVRPAFPCNALTRNNYNGVNILALWAQAQKRAYTYPVWASYRQWQELGCQVRRGEKASTVVFYKTIEVDAKEDEPDDDGKRLVARSFSVFNAAQVDGYTPPPPIDPLPPVERLAAVDRFIEATHARIREHGR